MSDRGSGTVATAMVMLVLVTLGGVSLGIVQAHLAAARVQAAADLAALAAAQADGDACARASVVATANGADLVRCEGLDTDVLVMVQAPAPALLARAALFTGHDAGPLQATARAGQPSS